MKSIETYRFGEATDGTPIDGYVISGVGDSGTYLHLHAGMHGDEPESSEVAELLLEEIRRGELVPGTNLVVIPRINPTGLASGARGTSKGVDINRNFPTATWTREHTAAKYFPGEFAGSEPETRAVIYAMDRFQPHAIVTLHTWVPQVNFDGDARAERLAQFLAERNGYPITPYIGYPTPGSFGTFAGIERSIPTITLEMPENSGRERCLEENGKALRALIVWGAELT